MNEIICFEIMSMNKKGITLKHQDATIFVDFKECAKNFANENSLETSKCVAERDITALTFIFYMNPKVKVVFKKQFFKNLLSGKTAVQKFQDLQSFIIKAGFTSYDLS